MSLPLSAYRRVKTTASAITESTKNKSLANAGSVTETLGISKRQIIPKRMADGETFCNPTKKRRKLKPAKSSTQLSLNCNLNNNKISEPIACKHRMGRSDVAENGVSMIGKPTKLDSTKANDMFSTSEFNKARVNHNNEKSKQNGHPAQSRRGRPRKEKAPTLSAESSLEVVPRSHSSNVIHPSDMSELAEARHVAARRIAEVFEKEVCLGIFTYLSVLHVFGINLMAHSFMCEKCACVFVCLYSVHVCGLVFF